jgi:methyltransferase (TIGR00027 family)
MPKHSQTAEYMALFRALESARSRKTRLFTDPWASRFLRPSLRVVALVARVSPLNSAVSWFIDRRWPGARASGVARTRYIDDALGDAIREGPTQVVILGAGFDSRPYRVRGIEANRVFEVDHPDTSRTKQDLIRKVLRGLPSHVSFVSIDFNRENLVDVMRYAGLDLARPTTFVCEGVTNYLTEAAVDSTFRCVATTAARSKILFTYVHHDVLRRESAFAGAGAMRRLVDDVGEPWTFGFDPEELPKYLEKRGLRLISDVGSTEYRARYMGNRGHHLVGYEFYRIALAEVVNDNALTARPGSG